MIAKAKGSPLIIEVGGKHGQQHLFHEATIEAKSSESINKAKIELLNLIVNVIMTRKWGRSIRPSYAFATLKRQHIKMYICGGCVSVDASRQ